MTVLRVSSPTFQDGNQREDALSNCRLSMRACFCWTLMFCLRFFIGLREDGVEGDSAARDARVFGRTGAMLPVYCGIPIVDFGLGDGRELQKVALARSNRVLDRELFCCCGDRKWWQLSSYAIIEWSQTSKVNKPSGAQAGLCQQIGPHSRRNPESAVTGSFASEPHHKR